MSSVKTERGLQGRRNAHSMVDDENELIELRYRLGAEEKVSAEMLSECLMEFGAQSVDACDDDAGTVEEVAIYREPETEDGFDVFLDPSWKSSEFWSNCIVRAIVSSRIEESLVAMIQKQFDFPELPERKVLDMSIDWLHEQEMLRPEVIIGDLRIILPWHETKSITKLGDLKLEGGAAFGTGEHPTTRMCCKWIQEFSPPTLARILDYGCGSGILALTALKTGHYAQAVGVDLDPDAILAAKRNAHANSFNDSNSAAFYLPSAHLIQNSRHHFYSYGLHNSPLDTLPSQADLPPFDLVVANILLNPLRDLSHTLASYVHPGHGVLAVSGIRQSQFLEFSAIYAPYFADIRLEDQEDGWILVICRDLQKTQESR